MRPHITRGTLLKAAALFAIWTAYGLLSGWEAHYRSSFGKMPLSWFDSFRYELSYAYLWAICTPAVFWVANRYRLDRRSWPLNLLIHSAWMALFISAVKLAWDILAFPPNSCFRDFTWSKLFRSIESGSDIGLLIYWIIVLLAHSLNYYSRYQAGILDASRLQMQLAQAQLQALKMQLHPHFLFNTLHTITALVHEDPDAADRTIARLSELLRLFLANSSVHEVSLSEELRILDLYLEIERTRFEDRLSVEYDLSPEVKDAMVPNLLLQPLVENAIRHGIGNRSGRGYISISAEKSGNTLAMRVADNGVGLPKDERQYQGMGLAITRGRLETLYGSRHSFELGNRPSGGVEARIVIPFRTEKGSEEEYVAFQSAHRG